MRTDLIVREPELYFDSIHQELNNFLRDTFVTTAIANPLNIKKMSTWRPAVEVKQNDKNYKVKVQLPGVKKDDIEVEVDNDFMTISAEIQEEREEKSEEEKNERFHTSEFRYGKYKRTISFDAPIKPEESTAEYKDGLLIITVPKQNIEQTKPQKLEIKYNNEFGQIEDKKEEKSEDVSEDISDDENEEKILKKSDNKLDDKYEDDDEEEMSDDLLDEEDDDDEEKALKKPEHKSSHKKDEKSHKKSDDKAEDEKE